MAEDSLRTLEFPQPDPSTPRRVFLDVSLKDVLYPMMPHSMYCLPLWPGITLVLLTKVCGHQHTSMYHDTISHHMFLVVQEGVPLKHIYLDLFNYSVMQCLQDTHTHIVLPCWTT